MATEWAKRGCDERGWDGGPRLPNGPARALPPARVTLPCMLPSPLPANPDRLTSKSVFIMYVCVLVCVCVCVCVCTHFVKFYY